ncbi:MAG: hypothetical protein JO257_15090 [Deltaproteobacteria bacterium]|nr:hypothetical protein [Deltaproteobacteria bacterium]
MFVALFSKDQLRPVIKDDVVPAIAPCFNEAGSGVANLQLTFDGTPKRLTVALKGVEGTALPEDVRACVRETLATLVLPPIGDGGTADIVYPFTYAVDPPDNHDLKDYLKAVRADASKHWSDALVAADAGLKLTSLDGRHRRVLIRIAGVAACHLGAATTAARYEALASTDNAATIRAACARGPAL